MILCSGILVFFFVLLFNFISANTLSYEDNLADIVLNYGFDTFEVIKKYGYPLEVHRLIAEDGYIIEIHRIPHGHSAIYSTYKPAVLLAPGLDLTSLDFVSAGNRSLAFILSEAGYDVWVYNTRGTRWSRKHVSLNPDLKEFWMFSWHEIGIYDYPACIDYITNVTKLEKIFFIGYSQGGTSFGALMSERPEYNEKVRVAILVAASLYSAHNKHALILYLAKYYKTIKSLIELIGLYEVPTAIVRQQFCGRFMFFCKYFINIFTGYQEQIDEKFLPVFLNNPSSGFSATVLEHHAQIFATKRYEKMDYGPTENLIRYGTESPPKYDLSKITTPIALFCGRNDPLVTCEDTSDLANDLPNVVLKYVVPYEMWNHLDFLFAKNAPEVVFKVILHLMQEH